MLHKAFVFLVLSVLPATFFPASACTSLLVTKGASTDGSVMVTYTCDGEFHPHLKYAVAKDHAPGDSVTIRNFRDSVLGTIPQVPHTYGYVGFINEYQLAIGETTFDGRMELWNPDGLFNYVELMRLALQRAKTAREAIGVMTGLVEKYGYRSTGESFSIADTKEAWIMEMIGPGKGGKGALWVARKVPDGYISCHANKARIGEFPIDDPGNCVYSGNVVSFAVEKGYYDPKSGAPFSFADSYDPATVKNKRYGEARVWSIFCRAAPSRQFSPEYHRGVEGAKPYPLWIKPDKKASLADVFAFMRDHYEGTDYDMTKGVDAGPFGSPLRTRPIFWSVDSTEYQWERPISTQQTAYSFVSQSRSRLPDPVGGVLWYGLDDTYFTCYVPFYCSIDTVPRSFTVGSFAKFSFESAWWVFNFVSNIAQSRYRDMAPEMQAVQKELEGKFLALQPAIEKTAAELARTDAQLMRRFLTEYCVYQAETAVGRWRGLGEHLLTKYNDGYLNDGVGEPRETGYPEGWLRNVLQSRPEQFRVGTKKDGK